MPCVSLLDSAPTSECTMDNHQTARPFVPVTKFVTQFEHDFSDVSVHPKAWQKDCKAFGMRSSRNYALHVRSVEKRIWHLLDTLGRYVPLFEE